MVKTITIVLIGLLFLTCFTFGYYYVLDKMDYGVISYDEYLENPECEFKQLDDGWTQLSNCATYKFIGEKR